MTSAPVRFDWEVAVQQDENLKNLDVFVQRTISKLPGQAAPVRADAGRGGSRYQPAPAPTVVKKERVLNMGRTANNGEVNGADDSSGSDSGSTQFINFRDYQTESSSEIDMQEVNPMDELSDFESEPSSSQPHQPQPPIEEEQPVNEAVDDDNDVDMVEESAEEEGHDEDEDEDAEQTVCEVCKVSENEGQIILCDGCDAEFHIYCLNPPLPAIPDGDWWCPKCSTSRTEADMRVKDEQAFAVGASGDAATPAASPSLATANSGAASSPATFGANGSTLEHSNVTANGSGTTPSSIPIAKAFEGDPEKSNLLLVHACNCDDVKCSDPEFHVFCPHMKRFLRSVCWATHNDKWRSYRLARITAELFAYHAMNCSVEQCSVPLCVTLREEEIV
ncbi:PHD and RING finger domain-containing protein 1 [Phytophthora boehmeriae]|uniref:PHD and RING finger domain-containing protein 1 n=1 Tax=Phytophthora boehmeriae TaxID=109152 RepID=A0A8T1WXC5_9STRA|nr:PHD and RING finger domain-containing protein 1 [Phytophthora boehmeriae]